MRNNLILEKQLKYIERIQTYVSGLDVKQFSENTMLHEACVFCISQIGELVGDLDDDFKEKYSEIPWAQIAGLRHHIVHDYEGIILERIWDTIENSLPVFKEQITKIITE